MRKLLYSEYYSKVLWNFSWKTIGIIKCIFWGFAHVNINKNVAATRSLRLWNITVKSCIVPERVLYLPINSMRNNACMSAVKYVSTERIIKVISHKLYFVEINFGCRGFKRSGGYLWNLVCVTLLENTKIIVKFFFFFLSAWQFYGCCGKSLCSFL